MARRYVRDNRGRFASVGATARGGRLKTAGGNSRKTQKVSVLSGDRMSSVPVGAIGRTRKQRQITMIDRPLAQRPAYNAGRAKQQLAIAARKAPKAAAAKRITAQRPTATVANKTGQAKTLNKFNSRPVGTLVAQRGSINLVPSKSRVPLNMQKESDQAFARTATRAVGTRKKSAVKAQQRQTTAQRAARAGANEKRILASLKKPNGTGFKRPTKKQRRSIMTLEAAKSFYASKGAVDTLRVNVKKPGFRMPRSKR